MFEIIPFKTLLSLTHSQADMEEGKHALTFGKTDLPFHIEIFSWFSYFEAMLWTVYSLST